MNILSSIRLKNFKCFRKEVTIDLSQATFLVGVNNSGKTAVLEGINCFFNDDAFKQDFLNKTEFTSKQAGYNRSEISIFINTAALRGLKPQRIRRIKNKYGNSIEIKKLITLKEATGRIEISYRIDGQLMAYETVDPDIKSIIEAVSVSYIHPQEGTALLERAQEKFKARLFQNWGRHASVSEHLRLVQQQWDEMRRKANEYLSSSLTHKLRAIWPGSSTKVQLPENIQDIVAISDINFKGSLILPEIPLTSQGTGVQSTVLYQTHYLLDSDRSLHRGQYYPIWLLEEPESFLHADIAFKLACLLSSEEWLANIQMVISTHSPIILAASKQSEHFSKWVIMEEYSVKSSEQTSLITAERVKDIGSMMGDPNFLHYFEIAKKGDIIYIEDNKEITKEKFIESGIRVSGSTKGIGGIKERIRTLTEISGFFDKNFYFILDGDNDFGKNNIVVTKENLIGDLNGFRKVKILDNVFLIFLPLNTSVEHLFDEYNDHLRECCSWIFDANFNILNDIPKQLCRTVGEIKGKNLLLQDLEEAENFIKNHQEVKDLFWQKVKRENLRFNDGKISTLKTLVK